MLPVKFTAKGPRRLRTLHNVILPGRKLSLSLSLSASILISSFSFFINNGRTLRCIPRRYCCRRRRRRSVSTSASGCFSPSAITHANGIQCMNSWRTRQCDRGRQRRIPLSQERHYKNVIENARESNYNIHHFPTTDTLKTAFRFSCLFTFLAFAIVTPAL